MEKYDIQVTAKVSVYMFLGETAVRHASQTNGGAAVASAGV